MNKSTLLQFINSTLPIFSLQFTTEIAMIILTILSWNNRRNSGC